MLPSMQVKKNRPWVQSYCTLSFHSLFLHFPELFVSFQHPQDDHSLVLRQEAQVQEGGRAGGRQGMH